MTSDDKAYAALAREHSSLVFVRKGSAIFYTSTCVDAPVYLPLVGDRTQTTALLHTSIANFYQQTMAALATGRSTCRNRKDAIAATASHYGRSIRTVEAAISTVLPSTAAT